MKTKQCILIAAALAAAPCALGSGHGHRARVNAQADPCAAVRVYDYECVDRQPQFPGGDGEMLRFINHERRYPRHAYRRGIQGRVLCSFVVHPDGSISHIAVMRGVEQSLDREAVRVISQMPRWHAGRVDGERVPVLCFLPISFRM